MKKIKFYLDFDGTITKTDVVDMMLDRYADKAWQKVEKQWQQGKIGSRECLSKQVVLLRMTPDDLTALCREVKIDEYFISFLKCLKEFQIPVRILSDGFENVIGQVLGRELKEYPDLLLSLSIFSNKIEWTPAGPKAVFLSEDSCRHGCANCKPEVIKNTAWADDTIFFAGDGLSDRYAAQLANISFAKGKLLQYCIDQDLNHLPYEHFGQIEDWLRKNYEAIRSSYEIHPEMS